MVIKKIGRVGITIEARCFSTRLPSKVLLKLPFNSEFTVLEQIINRAKNIDFVDDIVVATTTHKKDKAIVAVAKKCEVSCFRGDEDDVLSRIYHAAKYFNMDHIVRLMADDPCIDSGVVSKVLEQHIVNNNDYTTSDFYPLGTNVDILSFNCLKTCFQKAQTPEDREHVSWFAINHLNLFKNDKIDAPEKFRSSLRLTLDTSEDYALICAIYDYLYDKCHNFNIEDIVKLFNEKKWLKLINGNVQQKKVFFKLEDEVREAIKVLDFQDLKLSSVILKSLASHL